MKRFSKIFAVLLTLTLLLGVFTMFASAETGTGTITNHSYSNDYQSVSVGSTVPNIGAGSATSTSSFVIAQNGENQYARYSYLKDITGNYSSCRRDFKYGNYSTVKSNYDDNWGNVYAAVKDGTVKDLSYYSYIVIDFDVCADKYRYLIDVEQVTETTDEEGNPITETKIVTEERLSATYPTEEGAYDIRLSYSDNSYFNLDNRPIIEKVSDGTKSYSMPTNNYNSCFIYFNYDEADGVWKVYKSSTFSDSNLIGELSNVLGEWNHFTYVIDVDHTTLANSKLSVYKDGVYSHTSNIWRGGEPETIVSILPHGINWTIKNFRSSVDPKSYHYSMGFDNLGIQYYSLDYSSGDVNGVDDLVDSNNTEVTLVPQCPDMIYNENYVLPYPNGYTDVNGSKYCLPYTINKALKNIENGSEVVTTMSILGMDPPAWTSFDIKCDSNIIVTLSDAAIARGTTLTKTPTGYSVNAGIKANMSLFNDMRFNLYLPKVEGAEITSVKGATLSNSLASIQGKEYYIISATPDIDSFEAITATINYTIDGESKSFEADLDPMSYASIVASTYECGSKEAKLIYEMVRYKYAVADYISYDFTEDTGKYAAFMAIYDAHEDCKCKDSSIKISDEEKNVDYSALKDKGVTGVAYKLSLGELGVIINVESGVVVEKVSYKNSLGDEIVHTVEKGNLKAKSGYYFVDGVSAANIDAIMTITVDGVSGEYCLGKYITNNPDFTIGQVIYSYATAAESFKNITEADIIVSVDYVRNEASSGEEYYVEGIYVGVNDEGVNYNKSIILKSPTSDNLISVRSVPYGDTLNHGYTKGDYVRLHVRVADTSTYKTRVLVATDKNPLTVEETILSTGNEIKYTFENVVEINNWTEMKGIFNINTIEAYTYVHFKGTMYMNYYAKADDKVDLHRPHFNKSASELAQIKPDGARAIGFRENMLVENTGNAWETYFGSAIGSTKYPGNAFEADFYAVYTSVNGVNFMMTVLDASWFVSHEHTYEGDWLPGSGATVDEYGSEYRECTTCGIREYRETEKVAYTSLVLESLPTKTSYYVGDILDITGLKAVAIDANGARYDVTSEVTLSKVIIDGNISSIKVSYKNVSASYDIKIDAPLMSVSDVKASGVAGSTYTVEGYVVGFSQNGPGSTFETLIKDLDSDEIIALNGVSYSNFAKGDKIRACVTYSVTASSDANVPGKQLITYAVDASLPVSSVIMSRGNEITYNFNNVVTLDSPADWKAFFNDATLTEYTYVRITEKVYGCNNQSDSDTSGYYLQKIHTYPKDSGKSAAADVKFDGRNVSFRDKTMELNLGADYRNYFNGASKTSNDIYSFEAKAEEIIAIYTGANKYYFQLNILDEGWFTFADEGEYTDVEALLEIANIFDGRGSYIQYNQTHSRRHINPSPEEATAQNQVYLDCSSFVNAVYYETFGENILPYTTGQKSPSTANYRAYAQENVGIASDVIGYWLCSDYKTAEAQQALLAEVKAMLQPGDILNYRKGSKGTSGHVYIYIGDGKVMHCTGSDFVDADDASQSCDKANNTEKNTGSISIDSISIIFDDTTHTRYLFNNQYDFCLLRPMNRGLTLTEKTVNRMAMRGVDMTLSSDAGNNTAVYRGETITYTLKVNNTLAFRRAVTLESILSDNVTFVSGSLNFEVEGNKISSSVIIAPFSSYTYTFTVAVNADAEAGSLAQCNTSLGGVSLMEFRSTVSEFTEAEMALVVAKAREFAEEGRSFSDPALMVEALYNEALGIANIYSFDNTQDLLASFTYLKESNGYYYYDAESELVGVMAPNLYGGFDIAYPNFYRDKNLVRLITRDHISVGDATIASDSGKEVAFIYLGGQDFLYIDNVDMECKIVTMTDSPFEPSNILVTFFAYDRYVTIRPSMFAR